MTCQLSLLYPSTPLISPLYPTRPYFLLLPLLSVYLQGVVRRGRQEAVGGRRKADAALASNQKL